MNEGRRAADDTTRAGRTAPNGADHSREGRAFLDPMGALAALVILVGASGSSMAAMRARGLGEPAIADPPVRISSGDSQTCVVIEDGSVRCWGDNSAGQLGDGTTTTRPSPVSAVGITSAVAVAAGHLHTCALLVDGTVQCWGLNRFGQLGDSTTENRPTPGAVAGVTGAVALAAGFQHTCALIGDGTVRCWGDNTSGRLGDGTTTRRLTATAVVGLTDAVALEAGDDHTCALRAGGGAVCWGSNRFGQLGDGTAIDRFNPAVVGGLGNAIALAAGGLHTCALRSDGTARCWGRNAFGQLGDGTISDRSSPTGVGGLSSAVGLSVGVAHTCALLANGTARCWGRGDNGQIGDGATSDRTAPSDVSGLVSTVALAAGLSQTCALRADGGARCWGLNNVGQLGNGANVSSPTSVAVSGLAGSVTARDVAGGGRHTCAVRANGAVACWGANASGQLGDGTTAQRTAPVAVVTARPIIGGTFLQALTNVVSVAAGEAHTCALQATGGVRCWGKNANGQLGDGTTVDRTTAVTVGGLSNVVSIAAGGTDQGEHTCALLADGTVRCWGRNADGQLGDGTTSDRTAPVAVSGVSNAVAIAAGGFHTCALIADGTGRCWGRGTAGQLGDATGVSRSAPVAVSGLSKAVAISAGTIHTCAALADGTGRCWGRNLVGELGDGTTIQRLAPALAVFGLGGASGIAAGGADGCAPTAQGRARCWGDNASGQLGDGTTARRSTSGFVTISLFGLAVPLTNVAQLSAGGAHNCAALSSGSVRCWGWNAFGQIGDGTTTSRLRAVSVPSFALNIDPVVSLDERSREASVTIIAVCDAGERLRLDVSVTQGDVTGRGVAVVDCEGGLGRYPVAVHAHGRDGFEAGPAQVAAEAVIGDRRDRGAAETEEWTRAVEIVLP